MAHATVAQPFWSQPLMQPPLAVGFMMDALRPANRSVHYQHRAMQATLSNVTLATLLAPFVSRWHGPYVVSPMLARAAVSDVTDVFEFLASKPGASITLNVEALGSSEARRLLGSLLPSGYELFGGSETRNLTAGTGSLTAHVYITTAGGSAASPHVDGGEVLVQQLMGEKAWRFAPWPEDDPDEGSVAAERARLRAGDALWLAPRTWHVARVPRDARVPSTHITFERCKLQHPWCESCSLGICDSVRPMEQG